MGIKIILASFPGLPRVKFLQRFLLDTGRMPHPVGGDMGVIYVMMTYEGDTPRLKWLHYLIKYS